VVAGSSARFSRTSIFSRFPEASVNFQVSREKRWRAHRNFVTGIGENVSATIRIVLT